MLSRFKRILLNLWIFCRCSFLYPITPHVSIPAYKHMCLYSGHKHMCLYPVDIYKSLTKSMRFRITVIPLVLLQITVALAKFFYQITIFVSVRCLEYQIASKTYFNYQNIRDWNCIPLFCSDHLSYWNKFLVYIF